VACSDSLALEHLAEVVSQPLLDIAPIGRAAQPFERCDPAIRNAARHDEVEMAEVGRMVQRETMARDPPRNPDADGGQLLVPDPDAGESPDAPGLNTVIGRGPDHHFFQVTDVTVNVTTIRLQVDDGISDDLPRPVVRDVATPTGFEHLDALRSEGIRRRQDVRAAAISADGKSLIASFNKADIDNNVPAGDAVPLTVSANFLDSSGVQKKLQGTATVRVLK